jgi:hypothetical protein
MGEQDGNRGQEKKALEKRWGKRWTSAGKP